MTLSSIVLHRFSSFVFSSVLFSFFWLFKTPQFPGSRPTGQADAGGAGALGVPRLGHRAHDPGHVSSSPGLQGAERHRQVRQPFYHQKQKNKKIKKERARFHTTKNKKKTRREIEDFTTRQIFFDSATWHHCCRACKSPRRWLIFPRIRWAEDVH